MKEVPRWFILTACAVSALNGLLGLWIGYRDGHQKGFDVGRMVGTKEGWERGVKYFLDRKAEEAHQPNPED